jgi:hypothetical protein
MAKNFRNADDGEIFSVNYRVAASVPHALSPYTKTFKRGIPASECLDEERTIQLTRSLSGRD